MLCNIPSFLNKSGLIERQFLMVTLAVGSGKRGGKLSRSGRSSHSCGISS